MALSNIFREPRREITETVVGAAVVCGLAFGFVYADYQFALRITEEHSIDKMGIAMGAGLVIAVALLALGARFSLMVHRVGEIVCDALDRRGVELRPQRRAEAPKEWYIAGGKVFADAERARRHSEAIRRIM